MKKIYMLLFLGIGMLGLQNCKKECQDRSNPDCENYDPCYGKQKLTADFETYEVKVFPDNWIPYSTDTLASVDIHFRAKEENAEYEWTVGAETITTRSFTRKNFPVGVSIPITLRVRRKTDFGCFPQDSVAIQTHNIFVIDSFKNSKVSGCYQGYNTDNPTDTFTVCININDLPLTPPYEKSTISGLIKANTCTDKTFKVEWNHNVGFKQYIFESGQGECLVPQGRARVDSAFMGEIRIDYFYFTKLTDINSKVNKTFIGKRIY